MTSKSKRPVWSKVPNDFSEITDPLLIPSLNFFMLTY